MTSNFYSGIHKNLLANPEKVFLKWPSAKKSNEYNGAEILKGISPVFQALENGMHLKGEKILVGIPFSFNLVCALLGIMAIGAIPVLPPAGIKRKDLPGLISEQKIKAVVLKNPTTPQKILFRLLGVKCITYSTVNNMHTKFEPQPVSKEMAALISYSSGTTGKPKAVFRAHKTLLAQHLALKLSFPARSNQRDFPLFPNVLLHNLSLGITTIIPNISSFDLLQLEPSKIIDQLLKEKIDSLTGNVFYFKKLLQYLIKKNLQLPGVKELGIGGSPVPEFLVHELKTHFINANIYIIYGSTQAEPIAIRKVTGAPKDPSLGFCVGKVHPGMELKINPGFKILEEKLAYITGAIEVKGAHVVTENEWLATGDFGYLNKEGELYLTGREGNQTSNNGVIHYQLEHILLHIPGVEHAAAIVEGAGFRIFYQGKVSTEALKTSLNSYFPETVISNIHQIDKMPLDTRHHSKILYKDLCTQNLKM